MAYDHNAAASQHPATNTDQPSAAPAAPRISLSSLSEADYRPGHGQPGGNQLERQPSEPEPDPHRFDYPTPTPRRSYRSGHQPQ